MRVPRITPLRRARLEALLSGIWDHRVGVVVAPAGSGKTTLLATFASSVDVPVGWYRAESWDARDATMLRHLEAALTSSLDGLAGGWETVSDAARSLDGWTGGRALLVIDDVHGLEGTPAEQTLGRLIEYAPPWLAVLIGSRVTPALNLSRLRVSGGLLEIGPDELRFRSWEVEQLFRDHYGYPVPPDDVALLARRTGGWAAGLHLFHLATRGKSTEERRRILAAAGSGSRLIREYLTWNVLADLPDELRDFLVDTCVLGRLTGDVCDRLLGRRGSAGRLEELYRRRIFTVDLDEADGSYRYHEVLRSHLDRLLVERVGVDEARARYARAGELLESIGATAEALSAYSRAEDWDAVRRLLGRQGESLARGSSEWLEDLPPAIIRHEPWLELASARRARAEGRWRAAIDAYERAETGFGASAFAVACHEERAALRAWFEPVPPTSGALDWVRLVRAGLVRDPLRVARDAARRNDVPPALVRGLLALAGGQVAPARQELAAACASVEEDSTSALVAALGLGVARLLGGDRGGIADLDRAEDGAERIGATWLARLARSASRLGAVAASPLDPDADTGPDADRDPWGGALRDLIAAWEPGLGRSPDGTGPGERRVAAAERAASAFRGMDAGVLEAWARGLEALGLAESGAAEARAAAMSAEALARAAGVPGAHLLVHRAFTALDVDGGDDHARLAKATREETGLVDPPAADRAPSGSAAPTVPTTSEASEPAATGLRDGRPGRTRVDGLEVRLLGGFEILWCGEPVGLDAIRPRARALLRLLATRSGTPVHREVIGSALWPESDPAATARSLQVAISAVRGALTAQMGREAARLLVREGDAYRLAVPAEGVDLRRFAQAVATGRSARSRGESPVGAFMDALAIYRGDLLPEDGPEEWVVELREHYRREAVEASREAAEAALIEGDARTAIEACLAGIAIDRYHDPLWRLLIEARRRVGDVGAADRDRREYEAILSELGLPPGPYVTAT